jgi:hypothetical protein
MASKRKNLNMALNGLEELAERLQDVGGDVKKAMSDVLEDFADEITTATDRAVQKDFLPAKGVHSKGYTKESIIRDAKPEWNGYVASIGVGFDKLKPGSGGWLITGTPKMQPDLELQKIYGGWAKAQNRFIKDLNFDARQILLDAIEEAMKGK